MADSNILTGSRCLIYVNSVMFGRATSISTSRSTEHSPRYGLDSSEAFELVPTTSIESGTIGVIRLAGDGGAEGIGMSVPGPNMQIARYATLSIVDRSSDIEVYRADKVVAIGQSWSYPSKGLVVGQITFRAIRSINEVPPA